MERVSKKTKAHHRSEDRTNKDESPMSLDQQLVKYGMPYEVLLMTCDLN